MTPQPDLAAKLRDAEKVIESLRAERKMLYDQIKENNETMQRLLLARDVADAREMRG